MKIVTQKTSRFLQDLGALGGRIFIFFMAMVLLSGSGYTAAWAQQAASTATPNHSANATTYCVTVTPSLKNDACLTGYDKWDNPKICDDYNVLQDPSVAVQDVLTECHHAQVDRPKCDAAIKNNTVATGTYHTCPTSSGSSSNCPSSGSSSSATSTTCPASTSLTDLQSQVNTLCAKTAVQQSTDTDIQNICKTKAGNSSSGGTSSGSGSSSSSSTQQAIKDLQTAVTALKKATQTSLPDNQYGKYVNGANQYQEIRVNRASGDNRPAFVWVDGGGWHTDDGVGDKIAPDANQRGYTTFVVTYRLGSSGIYYMLDDIMRAMQHIRNNAGMYGIDPSRISLGGDSAGGSLAVRAASTGKTGAKVQVGWSTPTNAYTALFKSVSSFAIGSDHSTCVPTDLNGVKDITDQLSGGSGLNPKTDYTGGAADNGSSGTDTTSVITDVVDTATKAQALSETISKLIDSSSSTSGSGSTTTSGTSGTSTTSGSSGSSSSGSSSSQLSSNIRRLAAKKVIECIDNFNTASPALFASPNSPPGFFAGYDTDPLVGPDQAYAMRDKLHQLGVRSDVLILPGVPPAGFSAQSQNGVVPGENHLDYNKKFVPWTLDRVDEILNPKK